MNHRTVFARALAVSGLALIAAACAAPVENEEEATTAEAVAVGCGPEISYVKCDNSQSFDSSPFEIALRELGCSRPSAYDGEQGNKADFQTLCPRSTTTTFTCVHCTRAHGHVPPTCIPYDVTGTVEDLLRPQCQPYGSTTDTSHCGCGTDKAPSGKIYVDFDPTCDVAGCLIRYD